MRYFLTFLTVVTSVLRAIGSALNRVVHASLEGWLTPSRIPENRGFPRRETNRSARRSSSQTLGTMISGAPTGRSW